MKSNIFATVDLNLLTALELLLEERSVRAAARRAGVTPSAMSHSLGRLREQLGDPLLVRAGRALVPTPRAEALQGPLRAVLDGARALFVTDEPLDPAGLRLGLRLVCTDHVSTVLLPVLEPMLRREAPGVDLHVCPLVPETMEDLRRGLVDVAIGIFPEAPPEVRTRRLFDDAFVTVARLNHPRVGPAPPDLDAFLAEEHVLVAPRGTPRGLVDERLAERGLQRRVARSFPSFLSAIWHVARTDALLTVSGRLVHAVAAELPLQVWAPPIGLPPYTIRLAWHPRQEGSREQAWLRELLVRAAAALPRGPDASASDERDYSQAMGPSGSD